MTPTSRRSVMATLDIWRDPRASIGPHCDVTLATRARNHPNTPTVAAATRQGSPA